MSPVQASMHLSTILTMLNRLLPGFHTATDREDILEARALLEDVAARLTEALAAEAAHTEDYQP